MRIPIKPFPGYKWRWAELTPSEGLNNPVRLIGVLRTLYKHQGEPKSTEAIHEELEKIERETNSLTGERITLARTGERNLLRNSDRYWKALGLLDASSRTILLTPLGEKVAEGRITQDEFAVTVLQTLILPNRSIESDVSDWENAKLEIKPLQLILQILQTLQQSLGDAQAYITPEELQKVVIPIAGDKGTMEDYCSALQKYRLGMLDISAFPDCAPGANDKRMIREFLLFLSHYGFCHVQQGSINANTKYFLQTTYNIDEFAALEGNLQVVPGYVADLQVIEKTPVILEAQRRKKLREILERPQQAKFRRDVLKKFDNTCLLTGERLSIVLEACHIIGVEHKGTDTFANGLCLRADVHTLFDNKHIRIRPDGIIEYSETLHRSKSYAILPRKIVIPSFISQEALNWRYDYY